jgi:hypothetical protein
VRFQLLLGLFAVVATSCTTLSNRRDLYNPSEDAGPYQTLQPKKTPAGSANSAPREEPLAPSR